MNQLHVQMVRVFCVAAAGPAVVLGVVASAADAQGARVGDLSALSALQTGQWTLHGRDATSSNKSLCIQDVRALLQIEHGKAQCSRFVIVDAAKMTVVHYTCPGQGHGQTTLRVETPRLIQIDSQGVRDNEPFAVSFEGRRVGECERLATSGSRLH